MSRSVKEKDNTSLVRKIIPGIVAIAILIVVILYVIIQRRVSIRNIEALASQITDHIAGDVGNMIDYAESSINSVSVSVSRTMDSAEIENPSEMISPLVENTPFEAIEYIRADGMNVMNIGEPFDASDRVYYIEGIKGKSGIWTNFHPRTSQENLVNFYTPIYYENQIAGVVTGYIEATSQLASLFETKMYGEEIYGLLIDENDMLICTTVPMDYVKDCSVEMFLDSFGLKKYEEDKLLEILSNDTTGTVSFEGLKGNGRVSVSYVPGMDWKVAIIVPSSSFNSIIGVEVRNALFVTIIVILILIIYLVIVVLHNLQKRKAVMAEMSEIRDIIASANMGIWKIELPDDGTPRMYVDEKMKELLGTTGIDRSAEETYTDWFSNVLPEALDSVLKSVGIMQQGEFDENTYKWKHPTKGVRYVRCGGTGLKTKEGFLLRGYHYDVDEVVRKERAQLLKLKEAIEAKNEYYSTLGTLGSIFYSIHVLDLKNDTAMELNAQHEVKEIVNHKDGAHIMMNQVMRAVSTDEYVDAALEFSDLSTVADRMKDRLVLSRQLLGKRTGWYLASFITMEKDEEGKPTKVLFVTRVIDEEKKQEEKLIQKAQTDELTGVYNRRAYEEDIYACNDIPEEDDFVFVSIDVNGLKVVNDTKGHMAGDELIIGACQCMKESLGRYGKIFRTGGDEFVAIIFCDEQKNKEVLDDFDNRIANWSGKLIDTLSVSYGCASKVENPTLSVRQLGSLAEKRMYEAKSEHYRKQGVDRRGQQDAHKALCELYTKILKINLTEDSYQIINMNVEEQTTEKGFSDRISEWLTSFGKTGQVHPEDLEEYLRLTNLDYLKEYFAGDKTSLHVFYRRKYEDGFKQVMMELIPSNDYDKDNQNLFLYVKSIDK